MKKLVIDAFDLPYIFGRVESLLEFYPYGLKGLITDYLRHYLTGPPILCNSDHRDTLFSDSILQRYYDSPQYRLSALNPDDPATEQIIATTCYAVAAKTRNMVEDHERELRRCSITYETVELGLDCVLIDYTSLPQPNPYELMAAF